MDAPSLRSLKERAGEASRSGPSPFAKTARGSGPLQQQRARSSAVLCTFHTSPTSPTGLAGLAPLAIDHPVVYVVAALRQGLEGGKGETGAREGWCYVLINEALSRDATRAQEQTHLRRVRLLTESDIGHAS